MKGEITQKRWDGLVLTVMNKCRTSREQAEDCVQAAFVSFYNKEGRDISSLGGYILVSALNKFKNVLKSERRENHYVHQMAVELEESDSSLDPAKQLIGEQDYEILEGIASGYTERDIAESLGVARNQVRRVRAFWREVLGEE